MDNSEKLDRKQEQPKKKRFHIDTFIILLLVLLFVAILTWCFNGQPFDYFNNKTGEQVTGTVAGATLDKIFMAPINGLGHGLDIIGFVFVLGAFLGLTNATGALETGIKALVRKMHGHELVLIPVLMAIFAICCSTYGMCEETVGFYILLASTMLAAGMDPMVGVATVLLGAGVGCLGSTVNPFAVGAAVSASTAAGVTVSQAPILVEGLILLVVSYAIATTFVCLYAKKVLNDKGKSIFKGEELTKYGEIYGTNVVNEAKLTKRQVAVLWIFGFTFLVMILSFIPWQDIAFGGDEDKFLAAFGWSQYLTGNPLGWWYFKDSAMWFMIMGIVIGLVGIEDKSSMAKIIVNGFADMISVNLVIALSHGSAWLLETSQTALGGYLVQASVTGLANSGMPQWLFIFLDYILHIGLSFLVPSSSGLAGISSPIVSPIVSGLHGSVETSIMAYVAASGVVNLMTPTNGAIMGGLSLAKVEYSTWLKWSWKPILCIAGASALVLIICSF